MSVVTTLELDHLTASEGRITTIGHVFRQGDVPAGTALSASFGGTAVPLQVDTKATWPDGSIKHAVLSFENPAGAGSGTLTLEDGASAPATPSINPAAMAAAEGYAFEVEIAGEVFDVADALAGGSAWLSGSLASETRVTKTMANGVEIRADVRATADGEFDTSIIVGNDNVETTGLAAKTYAVTITQNGTAVYSNPALTQSHFTVWREKFSTAAEVNTAHAVYDTDYMRQTGLMPSVDDTIPLTDSTEYYSHLIHANATFDPMELGGINNVGGIDDDRGRSGGSPSYGLLTDDQHSYLVTQSAEARQAMLAMTDQFGIFSNYYRNPETGEAYFLEDTESNSYSTGFNKDLPGTGGIVNLLNDSLAQRNSFSHKPNEYYLSYLVTGDRYYADGLAHEAGSSLSLWANAVYITEGGHVDFASQLREQAWVMRDLFYAASLAPDGTRASDVLNTRLDAALQDYVDYYVNNDQTLVNEWGTVLSGERGGAWFVGGDLEGALQSYNSTGIDRPYWQDWFAMVIGQIALTGNEKAIELGEWMAGFGAERFLQDNFDPNHTLFSILDYPYSGSSANLAFDATWERLNNAATSVGGVGGPTDDWQDFTFYAGAAWGGAAAAFSGVRDARYAEALLWMTTKLTDDYVNTVFTAGNFPQFGVPVTFADYTIAGVQQRLLGTEQADQISDGGGNRLINAGGGNDTVVTGNGSHLVEGGEGADTITGGNGEDWLFGGSGADTLSGGAGINYLQGDRHDVDFGRFADDFVFTGTLGQTTIGDFEAKDTLVFTNVAGIANAADALAAFVNSADGATLDMGAAGRLVLSGVTVADLNANAIEVAAQYDEILYGTADRDRLLTNGGNDLILGYAGDDLIHGGAGGDELDGGDGEDWLQYHRSDAGVIVDLAEDANGMQSATGGHATGDIVTGFERVRGSESDDLLMGNAADNYLIGARGIDEIMGGNGADRIRGGADADTLDGGNGQDWLQYVGSSQAVTVNLAANADGMQSVSGGDATGDSVRGFEHALGSRHNDTLRGDAASNTLFGGSGDDTLEGGAGNDTLRGSAGADTLIGGAGSDWLHYYRSTEGVTVDLNTDASGMQTASGGEAEGDILQGFERIRGSNHDDMLIGNEDANTLVGHNSRDTILAGAGNDIVRGGRGRDTLDGGDGIDWVQFIESGAGVTVNLRVDASGMQSASGGSAEGDIISGFERVNASDYADTLIGNAAANYLLGRDGDDVMTGGAGNDTLRGDGGADIFAFASGDGADRILDFDQGADLIRLNGLTFGDLAFSNRGTGVEVAYGGADRIYLIGTGALTMTEADFLFT